MGYIDDATGAVPVDCDLAGILCTQSQRVLRNDSTFSDAGKGYQVKVRTIARKICVEERVDGTKVVTDGRRCLKFEEIEAPPKAAIVKVTREPSIPPSSHPCRRPYFGERLAALPPPQSPI
jgi:hypothetical protein